MNTNLSRTDASGRRERQQGPQPKTFYIDGAGAKPDGTGSGFGWVRADTDETRVNMEGSAYQQRCRIPRPACSFELRGERKPVAGSHRFDAGLRAIQS
jgi:hypothetical protein